MKKKVLSTAIPIAAVIAAAAIAVTYYINTRPMERVTVASPDWAVHYKTFQEVYDETDLLVVGKMTERENWDNYGVLFSTAYFDVHEVLKGEYSGDEIAVIYTGGERDGVLQEVEMMTLPDVGGEYMLALHPMIDRDNEYGPMGGYQGTFKLEDKSFISLTDEADLKVEQFNTDNDSEAEIIGLTPAQIAEKYGA